jgi:hypothetical protein
MWWDSAVDLENEHPGLVSGTVELMGTLKAAPSRFGALMLDYRLALRSTRLAGHLDSIGVLLDSAQYASAFSLVRTAFEHAFIDRLLLTATKRRVRHDNVDAFEERRLRELVAGDVPGFGGIYKITRLGKAIEIECDAKRLMDSTGRLTSTFVSPYFEALEYHDPLAGRRSDLADRVAIHATPAQQRVSSERSAGIWNQYLTWSAIRDNLVLNGFYTELEAGRLQAHYAFLSAFGHPSDSGYRMVDHQGGRCHFCAELALLYMGTLAAIETAALVEHCASKMDAKGVERYDDVIARVHQASAHLWFPPGEPTDWDRHQVVLQMHAENIGTAPFGRPIVNPASLTEEQIPYYADPLRRLIALHHSTNEMVTGLAWRSPWAHPQLPIHP